MLTPAEIATIRTRCEKTVMRCSYEAAGTGRHNDYKRDVSALLAHIQAQEEALRQVQAKGAVLRRAVESGVESCRLFKEQVPKGSVTAGVFVGSFWPFERSADEALSSTPAITAYAERVKRMEEALREIAEESPVRLDGWVRNKALAALEGDG